MYWFGSTSPRQAIGSDTQLSWGLPARLMATGKGFSPTFLFLTILQDALLSPSMLGDYIGYNTPSGACADLLLLLVMIMLQDALLSFSTLGD